MPFPNLAGRPPKAKSWTAAIERAILRMANEDPQALEKLASKLVNLASNGDLGALKEIGDRIEGKPTQMIAGDPEQPIEHNHYIRPQLTRDEWLKTLNTEE